MILSPILAKQLEKHHIVIKVISQGCIIVHFLSTVAYNENLHPSVKRKSDY
jgi:hypothetical protein